MYHLKIEQYYVLFRSLEWCNFILLHFNFNLMENERENPTIHQPGRRTFFLLCGNVIIIIIMRQYTTLALKSPSKSLSDVCYFCAFCAVFGDAFHFITHLQKNKICFFMFFFHVV